VLFHERMEPQNEQQDHPRSRRCCGWHQRRHQAHHEHRQPRRSWLSGPRICHKDGFERRAPRIQPLLLGQNVKDDAVTHLVSGFIFTLKMPSKRPADQQLLFSRSQFGGSFRLLLMCNSPHYQKQSKSPIQNHQNNRIQRSHNRETL
jgi:hypothetical protein